jgi:co-chaperonin GroES (HSP10)
MVDVGDRVLLPEWGGVKITLADAADYFLYRDDDILGKLHEPKN